jgi:hypothetical protein
MKTRVSRLVMTLVAGLAEVSAYRRVDAGYPSVALSALPLPFALTWGCAAGRNRPFACPRLSYIAPSALNWERRSHKWPNRKGRCKQRPLWERDTPTRRYADTRSSSFARRCDLLLQVSNDANGGTLWVLDYGKASHFGNIPRFQHDFPAELLCLFRALVDIVYCHIAEPGRGHSLGVRWYRHDTALAHVGPAWCHNRVGEVGHWKILSSPPEQLCIKFSRRARISGQEFIPAKLAMFGLCGVHIGYWLSFLCFRFVLGRRKLIRSLTRCSRQFLARQNKVRRFSFGGNFHSL